MEKGKSIYTGAAFRYGITNGFSTLLTSVAATFWSLFLTSAVGVETAVMAAILTFSSTVDLISIPLCAVVLQKVKFKKGGKFRPWLIIGGVGAALLRWLSFTNLGLTGASQAVWFAGTYILSYLFFNLAYSAFTGILPVMAKTPQERVAFSSSRVTWNSVGKFLFSLSSVSLIKIFGKSSEATGYSLFVLLVSVLVVVGFVQLFFGTKKYDVIETVQSESGRTKDQYDASIWEMIKYTITKPFILYLIGASSKGTTYFIITGLAAYYYRYVVKDMNMLTFYLTASTFLMIVSSFITPYVSKIFKGSRNTYAIGILAYGIFLGSAFFFGKTGITFTVIMCLAFAGYTFAHSAEVAVYSYVVDYTKWKSGKDLKPFMMTLFSLTPKIGTTIGAAVLGYGLVAVGFNKANVTPQAVAGIKALFSALPAVIAIISAAAMLLCPLSEKKVQEMHADIAIRDAEKEDMKKAQA